MSLLIKLDVLPESAVRLYAAEMATAVASVHALGVIHRDLKPDNFLLDHHGHLKLTDLGLCTKMDEGIPSGLGASPVPDADASAGTAAAQSSTAIGAGGLPGASREPHDRRLVFSTVVSASYTCSCNLAADI